MSLTSAPFVIRRTVATLAVSGLVLTGAVATSVDAAIAPLTNLSHLNFLLDQATPPDQPGHTTYRLAEEPVLTLPWTYADRREGGVYERVGGGAFDPATGDWGQGAFNADDVSRAAVVYLRHWQQTGAGTSRDTAYELLRSLTYLQTVRRPERRQRRVVDAARRRPEPERGAGRAARPVGLRSVVLAGPDHLGTR